MRGRGGAHLGGIAVLAHHLCVGSRREKERHDSGVAIASGVVQRSFALLVGFVDITHVFACARMAHSNVSTASAYHNRTNDAP
jgi:hypothetical protein